MNFNFAIKAIKSLMLIFFALLVNASVFASDNIKEFSILCEGVIEEIINSKVDLEAYHFDEFLIYINLEELKVGITNEIFINIYSLNNSI